MLAEQVLMLVRHSAFGAESRVKSILAKKGVDGVLEEVRLLTGDYARRIYVTTLLDNTRLDAKSVVAVLKLTGESMTSDYDRRLVLQKVATKVTLEEPATTEFVAVVDKMRSAYDKRQVLTQLIDHEQLGLEARSALLAITAGISSDYDRRIILVAYLDTYSVDASTRQPFSAAVRSIRSDYDRRQVLTKLSGKGAAWPVSPRREDRDRRSLYVFLRRNLRGGFSLLLTFLVRVPLKISRCIDRDDGDE